MFEVAENHAGDQLYVDAYAGEILSVVTTQLRAQGTYTFQIDFEIREPLEPVQSRFQIVPGAVEGVFAVSGTSLGGLAKFGRWPPQRLNQWRPPG